METETFKVLLLGDIGVGKTSMILRYTKDSFSEDEFVSLGPNLKAEKRLTIDGQSVVLDFRDTNGFQY